MNEGARVWLVPDGFIPEESSGSQESHEAICVLNTSGEEARLSISFYFEDWEPIKGVEVIVPPERTRHARTDELVGAGIPRGVPWTSGRRVAGYFSAASTASVWISGKSIGSRTCLCAWLTVCTGTCSGSCTK
jgi:hypothetical protein